MPVALGVNGGVLGSNNLPSSGSAKGIWTPNEIARAVALGFWPVNYARSITETATGSDAFTVGATADPYFEYTTLLLPGNGTNGAQNNTFLDGSTNNFTITRNGNTTQGTFSPFSQTGWGNYFSGTGAYLTVNDNAGSDLDLGSGQFSVEFWWYPQSSSAGQYPLIGDSTGNWYIIWDNNAGSNAISLGRRAQGNDVNTTGFTLATNTWQQVVVTRQSTGTNDTRIFVNGVLRGIGTSSQNYTITTTLGIGGTSTGTNLINGYLSNVRIVKGSVPADYQTSSTSTGTTIFTPPTSPLTAVSGTTFLTCQSNRFVDNSATPKTITVNGTTSVQAFSPFNPTASWSAATYGGSGYFDGSGDYLAAGSNAAWAMSTGDFSIEFWVYPTVLGVDGGYVSASYTTGFHVAQASGTLYFWVANSQINATSALSVNQWQHVVCTRASGTSRIFVNGVLKQTGANTNSVSQNSLYIGTSSHALTEEITGYMSEVRIVKGQIPTTYTTSSTTIGAQIFTPPTSPLTTSSQGVTASNTSLLLNFTNAGIYDATSKNDLETAGDAQISTTQSKWGGSSIYFAGTDDYIVMPINPLINFTSSGSITIELWVYTTSTSRQFVIGSNAFNSSTSNYSAGIILDWTPGTSCLFAAGRSTGLNLGSGVTANNWHHLAFVYNGPTTTNYVFLNGSLITSSVSSSAMTQTGALLLGVQGSDRILDYTGYIQDLRISNIARYTTNFTPGPTAAFPTL